MIDYSLDAVTLAQKLIGCELLIHHEAGECGGIIIETEAYTRDDPASHSFIGLTKRNEAMFMTPGTIYIYKIYGLHYCFNIVCGDSDGQAVLLRALLPTKGTELMKQRRGTDNLAKLCNGPANLVQALAIDPQLNGTHLSRSPVALKYRIYNIPPKESRRIGITKGTDLHWRFYM